MKYKHEDGTPFTKEEFLQKLKTDKEFDNEFGNKGIDQISELIRLLKETPDSRRMVVSAWAVDDLSEMVLPPCHHSFQIYTRELSFNNRYRLGNYKPYNIEGKVEYENGLNYITEEQFIKFHNLEMDKLNIPSRAISLMWSQRSVDTGLGLSFNIASYSLLLMMIAKQVNMVTDEVIGNLGDVHLYLNHIEPIKEQLTREPYSLPTVKISDRVVNDISEYTLDDIILENYKYHPPIKMPLSN